MRGFSLRVFIAFFCVHQRIVIDHAHTPEQGSDRLLLPRLRVSVITITFDTHTSIIYLVSWKIIPILGAVGTCGHVLIMLVLLVAPH